MYKNQGYNKDCKKKRIGNEEMNETHKEASLHRQKFLHMLQAHELWEQLQPGSSAVLLAQCSVRLCFLLAQLYHLSRPHRIPSIFLSLNT